MHRNLLLYLHELLLLTVAIVHCLMTAAKETIPLIPSALKHYWSAELDELKSISKDVRFVVCSQ